MLKVIGIGSPFGDDQVGLLLIEALRQAEQLQPYLKSDIELLAVDRPGSGLLSLFEGASKVVIIDAVVTGASSGQLHCWSDLAVLESSGSFLSSHGFGLAQALALGRQLGGLPEQLFVFGIEIDPGAGGMDISPRLQQKMPALTVQIIALLELYRSET